jgi:hypothetical protein
MATFSKDNASNKPTGVVFRLNEDGSQNPKYIDLLDEDKPVAGQKFTCISFISPEKIIKQRELFNFQDFLKQWDMHKSLEKFNQFLSFLSYKYTLINKTDIYVKEFSGLIIDLVTDSRQIY